MFCLSYHIVRQWSFDQAKRFNLRPIRVFDIIALLLHERFLLTLGMVLMRFSFLSALMHTMTFKHIFLSILLTHFLWNSGSKSSRG